EDLTFKPGEEKPAISFTFEAAGNEIEFRSVRETTVRCDRILTPAEAGWAAGTLILADEGSDVGQLLGRLRSYAVKFRQADLARESGSALEY
ncbi:Regulator of nonsense transcripts 1-like, partial [Durusdinium trenchii]